MRLDRERDRGNVSEDTEIVNDGPFVGYAEARYGPWDVQFTRGREAGGVFLKQPATFTIRGPFILGQSEGEVEREASADMKSRVADMIDSWDYVEAADEESYDPSE
jgi:hypothetical protein